MARPDISAEVNAVLDHAERVNEVAERYKAEAERNRVEAERARAELAHVRSRSSYRREPEPDHRAWEVAERYARLSEDSLRMLHNEREARLRAEEMRIPPPPVEIISPPLIAAPPIQPTMQILTTGAPPQNDEYRLRLADTEHLLRIERDKVTYLMLEKDRLENLLEAEKQRHEYEKDIMTDELEYRGQEKRYWQWWSSEERQELAQAQSTAEQLRAEADRMRLDLVNERDARQRAERTLEEYKLITERTNAEIETRITRSAEDMVNNYRRVIDTLEKQLEVYRRQAMENEVKLRELTIRNASPRVEPTTTVTSYSHIASTTPAAPMKETTTFSQYYRAESPVRSSLPQPAASSSYFSDQLAQLRKERDDAYSALARYEQSHVAVDLGRSYSPPRLSGSPRRRMSLSPRRRIEDFTSRRITRLSPTRL